jgi:aryl-alcohol dehydrogenase-like predicted oxidoreductase
LTLDPVAWARPRTASEPVKLVLGAMNFGRRTSEAEAHRIFDRAFERGVVHWDTANAYVDGESERIVGRAIRGRRDRVLVATKVGLIRIGGAPAGAMRDGGRAEGLSRERILAACDESLSRLGTDYVDVYYLHAPDSATPIEESIGALITLVQAGKIRSWAYSNYSSWEALEMIAWCDRERLARPIMAQQIYNLLVRQLDVEYFAFARKYGVHTAIYNPLAGGLLARRTPGEPPKGSRFDANPMYQRRYWNDTMHARVGEYRTLAAELGIDVVELSYNWLASLSAVDSILVGPGTLEHLDAAIDGCGRRLGEEASARIGLIHRSQQGTDAVYARR